MRIALFADIHGNRHAFAACLEQARELGAERVVLLGDYVGYGADPAWVVSAVMELVARGALAVLGAVGQPRDGNPSASFAILDTDRRELTYCRAPYDVEAAAAAIRSKGLPSWLADRLLIGA